MSERQASSCQSGPIDIPFMPAGKPRFPTLPAPTLPLARSAPGHGNSPFSTRSGPNDDRLKVFASPRFPDPQMLPSASKPR
ncbi:hypothetical protein [uncultured Sphingomonas sp.]|uniref:hypothetical protein n=1 Tax=uncultured Sphingomonas sp. TaxID=158754 RepID=UPI002631CE38|nr:hypothetical protein [uncultured Sphingomonas sp.]